MILTCPACDTKYVVKDGAIPAGGRQVRCASCKHSWHQDPDVPMDEGHAILPHDMGTPVSPETDPVLPIGAAATDSPSETINTETPQPDSNEAREAEWQPVGEPDHAYASETAARHDTAPVPIAEDHAPIEDSPRWQGQSGADEEEFVGYAPIAGEFEQPKRRWPLWLALILLIAAAAAAFWFFAPTEWKARAGIAEASATPLQLMITTRERQPMQSGQELVLLGGRIINPTEKTQRVPPIQVQLRDPQSRTVLHKWTITPPRNELGPGESTSFNSAEVDMQRDGEQLVDIALRQGPA